MCVTQRATISAMTLDLLSSKRKVLNHILREDLPRSRRIRSRDPDLDVQPAGSEHSRVNQILPIAGPDHDHVAKPFDPVDLRQAMRDDGGFDVVGDATAAGS